LGWEKHNVNWRFGVNIIMFIPTNPKIAPEAPTEITIKF
jgi:hypothetical protein